MRPLIIRRTLAGLMTAGLLVGCGSTIAATTGSDASTTGAQAAASTGSPATVEEALADNVDIEAGDTSYDEGDVVDISLNGDTASSDGDAVTVDGDTVTITAAGTYRLSGTLAGQVVVDSTGDGVVRLVLDDADITSDRSAAIAVTDAESVVVGWPTAAATASPMRRRTPTPARTPRPARSGRARTSPSVAPAACR